MKKPSVKRASARVKKVIAIPGAVVETLASIVPNLLNIQIKVDGAKFNPVSGAVSADEVIIDFNLGNKPKSA